MGGADFGDPGPGLNDRTLAMVHDPSGAWCSPHLLSGWPKKSPNFIFATKMVFPKSLKFMNSGSESLNPESSKLGIYTRVPSEGFILLFIREA